MLASSPDPTSRSNSLPDTPILFFGGKGGVGKTTMAAVAALDAAGRGHKTLLVSTDPAHSTGDVLAAKLGNQPKLVEDNCWAMEIDPEHEADRYIDGVKERVAAAAPPRLLSEVYRQVDIARVAPGAVEAALFDRFTRILEDEANEYDRIVFDTAPTGQTLRLLSLPELMTAWMSGLIKRRKKVKSLAKMWQNVAGSEAIEVNENDPLLSALEDRRERFYRARFILTDPRKTAFIFVVIPERLPIWETEKAMAALSKHEVPLGGVIVNQILPSPTNSGVEDPFLTKRRAREAIHLARISKHLGHWPIHCVTLQDSDPVGVEELRKINVQLTPMEAFR